MNSNPNWPKWSFLITIIILFISTSIPVFGQGNYDKKYIDPSNDVREYGEDQPNNITDREDIDILQCESNKALIKQEIIFKIKVAGKIKVDENFFYGLYILDGESEVYVAVYQNGTCIGINLESTDITDILLATGANTNTLQITIPIKNFGILSEFDFYAYASEYEQSDEFIYEYLDYAPDQELEPVDGDDWDYLEEKKVYITEPLNGSTVYQNIIIDGVIDPDEEVEYVEIQIDTESTQGWKRAQTNNNWLTWSYQWQTTQVPNGKHIIRSRAFNGAGYLYDNITVFIDQSAATNPEISNSQDLNVGDRFDYELTSFADQELSIEGASITGKMTFEVKSEKKLDVNGTIFDTYVVDTYRDIKIYNEFFSSITTMEGTTWLRISDQAIVKEDIIITSKVSGFGTEEEQVINEKSIYEPPVQKYKFPLEVSDEWETLIWITVESTSTIDGETQTETEKISQNFKFECLRTETIVLPVGTFETYLVYNSGEDLGTWETEDKSEIESEDSESIESVSGYSIDYYSPELGYFVKSEMYDENRNLAMSFELVSYERGSTGSNSQIHDNFIEFIPGFRIPIEICFLLIILLIIILGIILIIRRRRKLLDNIIIQEYATKNQVKQDQLKKQTMKKPLREYSNNNGYSDELKIQRFKTQQDSLQQKMLKSEDKVISEKSFRTKGKSINTSSSTTAPIQRARSIKIDHKKGEPF